MVAKYASRLFFWDTNHFVVSTIAYCLNSGVTRVGVTRGGNWGCHPYFFLKKNRRPFLLITDTLLIFHSGVTPLKGVTPYLILPVQLRLSTILYKFSRNFFLQVSPPPLEGAAPLSNATRPKWVSDPQIDYTGVDPWRTHDGSSQRWAERDAINLVPSTRKWMIWNYRELCHFADHHIIVCC